MKNLKQQPKNREQSEPSRSARQMGRSNTRSSMHALAEQYLASGRSMYDAPPEIIRALAGRIGNSAMLALLARKDGAMQTPFDAPARTPAPDAMVNEIRTSAPELTSFKGLPERTSVLEPFCPGDLIDVPVSGAGSLI